MDLHEVFERQRRLLLFSQLVGGNSLSERLRNCAWMVKILSCEESSWEADELVVLAQEVTPFLPGEEILREITKLKLLKEVTPTGGYELCTCAELHESGLPMSVAPKDCHLNLEELRNLLRGGPAPRRVWTQAKLNSTLQEMADFGFHCIRSWQSLVDSGNELDGVPFLWNVAPDGSTTPMVDLPASSATIDIVRLAIEPLNFLGRVPTANERELVQWAFDRIYRRIHFANDGRAFYQLPTDDSYPNTAFPVNDTQARVIHLLVQLMRHEQGCLDGSRRERAYDCAVRIGHYLLSQQLLAPLEKYDGFFSFHRYADTVLDGVQVLTINSELAMKAFDDLWPIADNRLKSDIATGIDRLLTALRRTVVRDSNSIAWQKHFSTLTHESTASSKLRQASRTPDAESAAFANQAGCEIFATARAMLIIATANGMGLCDDGAEYTRGAMQYIQENWDVRRTSQSDDVEFIPYRTPEALKWSDVTYRITNPISAIMPYYLLKSARLCKLHLPLIVTEPVNTCMDIALANYGGNGFWRDVPTGNAYPTNTVFNMEMIIEYLRASDSLR